MYSFYTYVTFMFCCFCCKFDDWVGRLIPKEGSFLRNKQDVTLYLPLHIPSDVWEVDYISLAFSDEGEQISNVRTCVHVFLFILLLLVTLMKHRPSTTHARHSSYHLQPPPCCPYIIHLCFPESVSLGLLFLLFLEEELLFQFA